MVRVHFVAGKGGVGKTVISWALARVFAKREKTLIVELSEEAGDRPLESAAVEQVAKNLFFIRIGPDQSLYEYLRLKIPNKMILHSLLKHDLIKALGAAMPGLGDLTRLGKIWFHADSHFHKQQQLYDKIVVDMPSSGFVGRFLSIASVVHDAVKIGPIAREARSINAYFANPHNARLHLVTLLQDLVVTETEELYQEIVRDQRVALGVLFINQVLPFRLKALEELEAALPRKLVSLGFITRMFRQHAQEQSKEQERLLAALPALKPIWLPAYEDSHSESAIIEKLVSCLESSALTDTL